MMPKSRTRKRKGAHRKGKGPFSPLPSMGNLRELAKTLDTPEMRELYRSQKVLNPNLDADIDKVSEEIKEIFNHGKNSE